MCYELEKYDDCQERGGTVSYPQKKVRAQTSLLAFRHLPPHDSNRPAKTSPVRQPTDLISGCENGVVDMRPPECRRLSPAAMTAPEKRKRGEA